VSDARPGVADYARLILVPAIWGGTFVAGKIVVASLTPLMGSFARYVIACVALLAAAFALEGGLPRLTGRQWLATFVLGLFGVFAYNLFFMSALTRLPASRAALIIALNPAVTIAISAVVLGERLSARRWAGVLLALFGVAVVVSRGDISSFASGGLGVGELCMFAAVTSWALYTILGRRVLGGLSPLAATNYAALWGTLLLGAVAAPQFGTLHPAQFDSRLIFSLM
jgi:drug/metabolite transporter (DMT)-like permease